MQIECDLEVPAFYIRFREHNRIHHSVDEDCELVVDSNGELVGISISFSGILEEFPKASISQVTQYCVREGWKVQYPMTLPSSADTMPSKPSGIVLIEFRKPSANSRKVAEYCTVDVDANGVILGAEFILTGNTGGPVRFEWLCQKSP